MISAEEAKEKYIQARKKHANEIIGAIDAEIEDKIDLGYSSIRYRTPYERGTYDWFLIKTYYEALGYKISLAYEDSIEISWN